MKQWRIIQSTVMADVFEGDHILDIFNYVGNYLSASKNFNKDFAGIYAKIQNMKKGDYFVHDTAKDQFLTMSEGDFLSKYTDT